MLLCCLLAAKIVESGQERVGSRAFVLYVLLLLIVCYALTTAVLCLTVGRCTRIYADSGTWYQVLVLV